MEVVEGAEMRWVKGIGGILPAMVIAISIGMPGANADPILQISSDGILTGAKYVDISGVGLYDVTFKAEKCTDVYGACDVAHFNFTDSNSAYQAALALDNKVFVAGGWFDDNPGQTAGCISPLSQTVCAFLTPYGFNEDGPPNVVTWEFENTVPGAAPPDRIWNFASAAFYTQPVYEDHYVFTVWTKSEPIPEPSGLLVFGAGVLTLAMFGLGRKIATNPRPPVC